MSKLINLIRPDLRDFNAYSSARDEASTGKIWLNANESPYPFAIENNLFINRYPEKQPNRLVNLLSSIYNVSVSQIVISRGSDEVIDLLTRLFCSAGIDSMMICPPTFGMYSVCAKLQNAKLVEVPLIAKNGFQLDLSSIMAQYNATVKIIFLCSPNNPTGNLINKKDIISLCENLHDQCIVVVDEAYVEFSDSESLATMINQYENLVILRTLSKAYGLAGARCGILLAQAEIAQSITKIIPPYPVPMNTSEIVFQTLTSKQNEIQKQIECIKLERARLFDILKTMSLVKTVYQSAANFLLFESDNAEQIMAECTKHGIILRKMKGKLGLENCIRVSIGLRDENNQFIAVLENMRSI